MSRVELARYRMQKAEEILKDAQDTFERNRTMLCVNRAYYAMFTSARALLALEEKDSSKHSGVISLFNQWIVKPGYFSREIVRVWGARGDLRKSGQAIMYLKTSGSRSAPKKTGPWNSKACSGNVRRGGAR